ncbi:hypothetical protein AB4Y32_16205 [Paraburkholderia phymatum]|uniref:Uncharacterized protein n=1 Tax=Paraburkholderia phymatum TaxID=148447 RepID=A0ACC6U1E5_9BURK
MSDINTGGGAFPWCGDLNETPYINLGVTVRDYFAAKAMQAIVSATVEADGSMTAHAVDCATDGAYFIADAMLRAREKP